MSECSFCGAKAYGATCIYSNVKSPRSSSSSGVHVHKNSEGCIYCGAKTVGSGCIFSPTGRHERGLGFSKPKKQSLPKSSNSQAENRPSSRERNEEKRKRQEREEEQENRQREFEEKEERARTHAIAAEARHALTLEVQCPTCLEYITAGMANDGETIVTCRKCNAKVEVKCSGMVTLLGPQGKPFSKAEDPSINEDRLCSKCRHLKTAGMRRFKAYLLFSLIAGGFYCYGFYANWLNSFQIEWLNGYWKIVGGILSCVSLFVMALFFESGFDGDDHCGNRDARLSVSSGRAGWINENLRCKYWGE